MEIKVVLRVDRCTFYLLHRNSSILQVAAPTPAAPWEFQSGGEGASPWGFHFDQSAPEQQGRSIAAVEFRAVNSEGVFCGRFRALRRLQQPES